jgi:GNAT superfamily N-acetyltransferase
MGDVERTVDGHRIEPLAPRTWDAFAALAERHNGVWGGCWCVHFHCYPHPPELTELGAREFKRRRVEDDRAHAALVFDGDLAVAWAEFGPVDELPNIQHRKEWEQGLVHRPDYRITCLFVDRRYRRRGMAEVAVRGALALIAEAAVVSSSPIRTTSRRTRRRRHPFSTTPPGPCTSDSASRTSDPRARATA